MSKAYIKTYGCQMNEQDSAQMTALLRQAGFSRTDEPHEADLILLNTCSIREKAVHKVYSDLGRFRPFKEDNPNLILGVAGCVAEQEKENLTKRFPILDLVFGPDHVRHLPQMLNDVYKERRGQENVILRTGFDRRQDFEFVNVLPPADETPVKAFVNIQKGCDNVCSFCIVPFVRGREVSRPHGEIIDEVKALVDRGVKEVMLLGQNVNSYGLKTTGGLTFARLLNEIASKTKLQRLRFTTSHPKDVGDDLITEFAENPILMPQFHLPVQSGNDHILDLMKRQYTRASYLSIIERLKKRVPHIRFSTDIIVGFPTETEKEFADTLSLINEVGYDQIFSFVYSSRPYTKAAHLVDDVPKAVKDERLQRLMALDREILRARSNTEVGSVQEVLIEECDEDNNLYPLMGRTRAAKIVHFVGMAKPGDVVSVKITEANPYSLYGSVAA